MGTVTAQTLIERIRAILLDPEQEVWTDEELLEYVSEGERTIPRYKADAYVKRVPVKLGPGTKQKLPSDGLRLIAVPRNLGTDGVSAGRAIVVADLETINREDPDWHTRSQSHEVIEIFYDPMDPKHFYVSPPNTGDGYVEESYSAVPPALEDAFSTLTLDDIYADSIVDWGCFRALDKLGLQGDGARASVYRERFITGLQAQAVSESGAEPRVGSRQ
jgi:hypothetical protein